ncbi:MAG: hypothetical protein R3C26_11650 [Calditrichia bacterium]
MKTAVIFTYAVEIPFAGEWLLVVRADTNAIGSYRMRAWWADVASRSLPEEADLCDAINFVIAHANADFYFITRGEGNNLYPNVQLPGQSFREYRRKMILCRDFIRATKNRKLATFTAIWLVNSNFVTGIHGRNRSKIGKPSMC